MALSLALRARQAQVFRLSHVSDLLRLSSQELNEHLAGLAYDNPMFVLRPKGRAGSAAHDMLETLAVEDQSSLYTHALTALSGLLAQGGMLETLVVTFIEELEPSGWLGAPLSSIAERHCISLDLVEAALRLVQKRIEPAGLLARNLAECLRLQLEDEGPVSEELSLVLEHLDILETGGARALADKTALDLETVAACLNALRRLDPKPGSGFHSDPLVLREPDVVVSRGPNGLEISYTNPNLADFDFCKVPRNEGNAALTKARDDARSVRHALHMRQLAIQRIIEVLVAEQEAFFENGVEALTPLTMSDVAEKSEFHTSTVSRVLNGLLIETPNGIVTGKSLCPQAVAKNKSHAKPEILRRIKEIIAAEAQEAPITDDAVTQRLGAEGIQLSRRVIAKYRQELGYPPASARRAPQSGTRKHRALHRQ